ncbi:hypothetical protein [Streptomyces sp. IBSBF 2394]
MAGLEPLLKPRPMAVVGMAADPARRDAPCCTTFTAPDRAQRT